MSGYSIYSIDTRSLYYYRDVEVLKNKLGIKDEGLLKEAEDEITFRKVYELTYYPINGRFGLSHILKIHKFIFDDIYYFAGKIRYERISKGQTTFCFPEHIEENLGKLFNELRNDDYIKNVKEEVFFERLAYYMSELNAIHPFREGNGRTIREFIRELALKRGYNINWDKVTKEELLTASIESIHDYTNLKSCLMQCGEKF
jgi:cell filamentation protein